MRTLFTLDYDEAEAVIQAIVGRLREQGKAAVVVVADAHGEMIAFARMDGAPISSIRIAENKAWTAARERKPTKEVGEKARSADKGFELSWFGDPKFTGWGGGIPVWRKGQVVGSIAVSGLPSQEDIELATFGASLIAEV